MSSEMPLDTPPSSSGPSQGQSSYHQSPMDPAAVKLTRGTSCVLCQQRKVRCDKNKPCSNCVKAKVECRVIAPQPPRRRKKRLHEKDLIDRLKKYETLLTKHGVEFEAIGGDLKVDKNQEDDVDELENDFEGLKTSPEASSSPAASERDKSNIGTKWFSLHKEFRASEKMLQDSSEDEEGGEKSTIYRAFDKMFAHDGFPFIVGGGPEPVTSFHPPTIHIFQLWQVYIDNINPLLKITHVPTVQGQIIEASSNLEKAPKNIEALMFGIYLMAITSLEDGDVQRMFHQPKQQLLGRYHTASQQALTNAGFMRVNDPITLQAFLLYLFAVRWFVDPRQVFCLVGLAVRIAQRMGLHRDSGQFGLPPFEVEQRRRLWWTIVAYDRRLGEMTGSTVSALSSGSDCKPPLNVNDSDLHVDGKELPTPHTGPTEMLFALTRVELSMAVSSDSNRDSYKLNNPDKSPSAAQDSQKRAVIRLAGQDGPGYSLDGFCAHMEGTYLTLCDPKIPLHFFTLTMTRQALCKMRIISFLVRMHDSEEIPLKEVERDNLFLQATQMIEYDNIVQSSESLRPFKWFSMHHFPFPAYMFLVQELRLRVSGPMVERAWEAVTANYSLRGLLNNYHSPMHVAFGSHFVKAWDAHAAAEIRAGKHPAAPAFIGPLRERFDKRRAAKLENRPDPGLAQPQISVPRPQPPGAATGSEARKSSMAAAGPSIDPSQQSRAPGFEIADPGEMDWSYLMSGYNDAASFPPMGGFGTFTGNHIGAMGGMGGMPGAGPMGPMGGPPGGPPGGNMYGN